MTTILKSHFPILWDREELMEKIRTDQKLGRIFGSWKKEHQEKFLDFCTGVRGIKLLYDGLFKEIMSAEYTPERLNEFLSLLLGKKVTVKVVLPNDTTRIADESSLLITDIVVELELLQKFLFIPLDIFLENQHNKGKDIDNLLDAWLLFFSSDDPEDILNITQKYPKFQVMYEQAYQICRNVEDVMGIFSEELRMLDRNTVQLMIDEMQKKIDTQGEQLAAKDEQLTLKEEQLTQKERQISEKDAIIAKLQEALKKQKGQ